MSEEPILENSERDAILRQVFKPKPATTEKKNESPSHSSDEGADASKKTFGSLLEESLSLREEAEDTTEIDEAREEMIKRSRVDLVQDMMKGFHL